MAGSWKVCELHMHRLIDDETRREQPLMIGVRVLQTNRLIATIKPHAR